jgi:plasmid maintenance system antidote protein VapI
MNDNPFKREVMKRCAAKHWDQQTLALVLAESPSRLSSILNMYVFTKTGIKPEFAINLSIALGETPEFWMNTHIAECLRVTADDPFMIRRLAEIRERAANWKPGMHCKPESKAYRAGYAAGYEAAKKEFQRVAQ